MDISKLDITKLDITKIDIHDIKTVKGIALAFLSIILIVDLFSFSSLIHNIMEAGIQRKKDASAVSFFKDLIARQDKLVSAEIISQDRVDDLLDEIQKIAQKNNVKIKTTGALETDQQGDQADFYTRKVFSVAALGSLQDVGIFLTTLRNMPDAVLDIESIHVSSAKIDSSRIRAKISFVVLTTKDDDNQ